jgi:5-methylcytosine-specific restriction protein A
MGVGEYQDWTFEINDERKLTDAQISADWHREFPNAKFITPEEVRGVRRAANGGYPGHRKLERRSYPYNDAGEPYDYDTGRVVSLDESEATDTDARRNPPWQRDELILALDLYIRSGRKVLNAEHPDVVALSELLNALPIHAERADEAKFRNGNGVALKLANFRGSDRPGEGMRGRNQLEQLVWDEFANDPVRLAAVAGAIAAGHAAPEVSSAALARDDEDEREFPEGRVLYRRHVARERNRALVKAKKEQVLQAQGKLACEVCTFDFGVRYGALGDGYIECHHTVPVSELQGGAKTRRADLALVCANCHRMLHRKRPWLALGQLSQLLG